MIRTFTIIISIILSGCGLELIVEAANWAQLIPSCFMPPLTERYPASKWMVPKLDANIRLDTPISIWVAPVEGGISPSEENILSIGNETFRSALQQTLNDSAVAILSDSNLASEYQLSARILNQDTYSKGRFGSDSVQASLEIQYNIQKTNTSQSVWQAMHQTEYTEKIGIAAPASDSVPPDETRVENCFYGTKAVEIAARENIRWFIQELSKYFSEEEL